MPTKILTVGADNVVEIDNFTNPVTGAYINDATVTFTIYRTIPAACALAAGQTSLRFEESVMLAGDAARAIIIPGAGAQYGDLRTTISAFVLGTEVTLATAAIYGVTEAKAYLSVTGGKDVAMAYVAASNGKYRGTFAKADALLLAPNHEYMLEIYAVGTYSTRWRRKGAAVFE